MWYARGVSAVPNNSPPKAVSELFAGPVPRLSGERRGPNAAPSVSFERQRPWRQTDRGSVARAVFKVLGP
eukprot:10134277-Lingulodinium_polyedra.AAC.1